MKRLIGLGLSVVGAVAIFEYLRRKGIVDQVKGEVKRFVGNVTDNEQLETEGVIDTVKGKTLKVVYEVKHVAKETIADINEAVDPKSVN